MNIKFFIFLFFVNILIQILELVQIVESINEIEIVETEYGKVRGIISQSRDGRYFASYLGIPFAEKPLGKRRFELPEKPEKWNDIRNAGTQPDECLQVDILITGKISGNEDCLYLNVYSPINNSEKKKSDDLLPVIIFIHGGGFHSGGTRVYQPKYFMDENIILVVLHYRLGAFGFLSTGDKDKLIKGNMGFYDQLMGVKFVKDNIKSFGGDPNRITLAGESAGASSVSAFIASPLTKGLFQQAITQSGSGVRSYISRDYAKEQSKYLGERVGCSTGSNVQKLVDCLKQVPAEKIIQVHKDAISPLKKKYATFGPIFGDDFLPIHPLEALKSGNYNKVPNLVTVNSKEGLLFVSRIRREKSLLARLNKEWNSILPLLLSYNPSRVDVANKVKNYYFNTSEPNIDFIGDFFMDNFTNMFSDRVFFYGSSSSAKAQSKHSPVFLSYFSYNTGMSLYELISSINPEGVFPAHLEYIAITAKNWFLRNILRKKLPKDLTPSHGDELSLLFNLHFFTEVRPGSRDYEMSKKFIKMWVDFAYSNDVLKFNGKSYQPINYTDEHLKYVELNLNTNQNLITEPFESRLKFWDSLNLPFM